MPVDTLVHARVQLENKADPSDTLASALFALGLFLTPEPGRNSLGQELEIERAQSDLFSGPLMLRGFIPDAQLQPFPHRISVDQVLQVLAETSGIVAVDTMSVEICGEGEPLTPGQVMQTPHGSIFCLQNTGRDGEFTIELYRDYVRQQPNPARVRRRLDMLWHNHRRTFPLSREYASLFGAPEAHYRDFADYTSIQNQFPNNYGINAAGLGPDATLARKGQAKQLKGYLMPFDQLMADQFSQLAFLRDLFSVEAGGDATYAWQSLRPIVAGANALLMPDYEDGLAQLTGENDPVDMRRSAILDLLLSLYGREVSEPYGGAEADASESQEAALIRTRQTMLRHIAPLSRDRGRGADYRRRRSARSIAGMERISRIQLGLLDHFPDGAGEGEPGTEHDRDLSWIEVALHEDANFGTRLPAAMWPDIERLFQPLEAFQHDVGESSESRPSPLAGRRVAKSLVEALPDPARYRIGKTEGAPNVYIVILDMSGTWWLIGEYADEESAFAEIRLLLRDRRRRSERHHGDRRHRHRSRAGQHTRLYVVDWILLRSAMLGDPRGGECYTFRVTAVASVTRANDNNFAWQREVEFILRQNTPAHVVLDCLFFEVEEMERFERLHDRWLDALRHCHEARLVRASRDLADFLTRAIAGPESKPQPVPAPSFTPAPTPFPTPPVCTPVPSVEPVSATTTPSAPPPTHSAEPEPTALPDMPKPTGEPAPTPSPTPEESASHPIREWFTWLWTEWIFPILGLAFKVYRFLLRRKARQPGPGPEPEPTPLPTQSPTLMPVPTPAFAPTPTPTPPPTPAPTPLSPSGTMLVGTVTSAPAGATGFDCNTVLTASSAAMFAEAGFTFAIRYVPRNFVATSDNSQGNLTTGEAGAILSAGLALMIVQHVAVSPWTPSQSLGESYGSYAAINASEVGMPTGTVLWLDLEGVASGTPASDIEDYCEAWFAKVVAAGYLPGLYIGANCGLTSDELEGLSCQYYRQSGSSVPSLAQTGYCMIQSISSSYLLEGIAYDLDVIQADLIGKTPVWLAPK
ncbi:MAG: DUF1906 domain-containing protein [Novosphingobium sp.]